MLYTLSLFSGVALLILMFLLFTTKLPISIKLRLQSLMAAIGISFAAVLMYLLFPIGLALTILVVLILLVSLILATRLERENVGQIQDWELPSLHTTFDDQVAATTEEAILQSEPVAVSTVEEEPVHERKQPLVKVGADESEELMTGRRRRIQDEEE